MATSPKRSALVIRTFPARQCPTAPTRLVVPTTGKLMAIASLGSNPSTYTKTGTVRIDPPPPNRPSVSPMTKAMASPTATMSEVEQGIPSARRLPLDDELGYGRDAKQHPFAPWPADRLQPDRKSARIVPGREADGRMSGEVRREGEAHHLGRHREVRFAQRLRRGIDAWRDDSGGGRDDCVHVRERALEGGDGTRANALGVHVFRGRRTARRREVHAGVEPEVAPAIAVVGHHGGRHLAGDGHDMCDARHVEFGDLHLVKRRAALHQRAHERLAALHNLRRRMAEPW